MKILSLENNSLSYVIGIQENGELEHLYFGTKIEEHNYNQMQPRIQKGICKFGDELNSLGYIKNEFVSNMSTDLFSSSYVITCEDRYLDFRYESHSNKISTSENILPQFGKTNLSHLSIKLKDVQSDVYLYLNYSIHNEKNIVIKNVVLKNHTTNKIVIDKLCSSQLEMNNQLLNIHYFKGKWINEFQLQKEKINYGKFSIYSNHGISSSVTNPFFMISEKNTDEFNGVCYGFNLLYSGNFENIIEKTNFGKIKIQQGISPYELSYEVNSGKNFVTPEAIITFSLDGFNNLSDQMHSFYHENLIPINRSNDVLNNSWEAMYFDFDNTKLKKFIDKSHDLGVNLVVLDDGWFGKRNDDTTSLGDWYVNKEKLVNGLEEIVDYTNIKELKFGLWIEPEMISSKSDLYVQHPEYALENEMYDSIDGRNQKVLDLSNREIVTTISKMLEENISHLNIEYIKWDMNRYITHQQSKYANSRRSNNYDYTCGLYMLLDNVRKLFPNAYIEMCSSGGSRFDLGILAFSPQIWLSDNTNCANRIRMQYDASYAYPISTFGSHISDIPNHQVKSMTPLKSRANVALFGTFGLELDPTKVSIEERKVIKKYIEFYQKNYELIKYGKFIRLSEKNEDCPYYSWAVASSEKILCLIYLPILEPNMDIYHIKFPFLEENKKYKIFGEVYCSNFLKYTGLVKDFFYCGNQQLKEVYTNEELCEQFELSDSSIVFEILEVK